MSVIWMRSPVGLEQEFFEDVNGLLESDASTWYVTEGYRTMARSNQLYAAYLKGGPRAAPGGLSPHNIGEAVDVVLDGDTAKSGLQMNYLWSDPRWHVLFDRIKAHPRLHSGVSFGDGPHIESVKFAKQKLKDRFGHYYIPVHNLRYLEEIPTSIRMA